MSAHAVLSRPGVSRTADDACYDIMADARRGANLPVISVIVPTRQRAALVRDTVEALFLQDLAQAYEIIVVDNASADGTSAVLIDLAGRAPCDMLALRMHADGGPARSRNAGIAVARGRFVAFTDSDCIPAPGWLRSCLAALQEGADVVQGRTSAPPWQAQPLFSHFIETTRSDGSFSTSNVAYRIAAVTDAGGFDPSRDYWEDVDLGWRVMRQGGRVAFAADALVYHQVVRQSPVGWLLHARRFGNWPAKAATYPEFRRHLFLGVWVDPFHALMTLAGAGVAAGVVDRRFLALALPYAAAFPFRHGLRGRAPVLKAAAHLARDLTSFAALVGGTIRHRSVVL